MQHQVAVIAATRAVANVAEPIAGMQVQYEVPGREIVVVSYAGGSDYQQIATLIHAATDQVTTTLRNVMAQRIAHLVFDAATAAGACEVGALAVDADPMSLYAPDHILGMTAQVSEIQVSYLPIHADPIDFATDPVIIDDALASVTADAVIDRPLADADAAPLVIDRAVGFVPQEAEAA